MSVDLGLKKCKTKEKLLVIPVYRCKNCGKRYGIQEWGKACPLVPGYEFEETDEVIEAMAYIDNNKPHKVYHNCGDGESGIAKMVGFVRRVDGESEI